MLKNLKRYISNDLLVSLSMSHLNKNINSKIELINFLKESKFLTNENVEKVLIENDRNYYCYDDKNNYKLTSFKNNDYEVSNPLMHCITLEIYNKILKLNNNLKIYDFGCGNGFLTNSMYLLSKNENFNFEGIDINENAITDANKLLNELKILNKTKNIKFHINNFNNFDFNDNKNNLSKFINIGFGVFKEDNLKIIEKMNKEIYFLLSPEYIKQNEQILKLYTNYENKIDNLELKNKNDLYKEYEIISCFYSPKIDEFIKNKKEIKKELEMKFKLNFEKLKEKLNRKPSLKDIKNNNELNELLYKLNKLK